MSAVHLDTDLAQPCGVVIFTPPEFDSVEWVSLVGLAAAIQAERRASVAR